VIVYDQTCAAEKRRRRKRKLFPDPAKRVVINDLVCEGCGDCGVKSNCVSVAAAGNRIRSQAHDRSIILQQGLLVREGVLSELCHGARRRLRKGKTASVGENVDTLFAAVPEPQLPSLEKPFGIMVTGVGGTGVVTIGAIVGMAAHLEGKRSAGSTWRACAEGRRGMEPSADRRDAPTTSRRCDWSRPVRKPCSAAISS
jgi:indolepyruvate ferredoxin oxidoreductase